MLRVRANAGDLSMRAPLCRIRVLVRTLLTITSRLVLVRILLIITSCLRCNSSSVALLSEESELLKMVLRAFDQLCLRCR